MTENYRKTTMLSPWLCLWSRPDQHTKRNRSIPSGCCLLWPGFHQIRGIISVDMYSAFSLSLLLCIHNNPWFSLNLHPSGLGEAQSLSPHRKKVEDLLCVLGPFCVWVCMFSSCGVGLLRGLRFPTTFQKHAAQLGTLKCPQIWI